MYQKKSFGVWVSDKSVKGFTFVATVTLLPGEYEVLVEYGGKVIKTFLTNKDTFTKALKFIDSFYTEAAKIHDSYNLNHHLTQLRLLHERLLAQGGANEALAETSLGPAIKFIKEFSEREKDDTDQLQLLEALQR